MYGRIDLEPQYPRDITLLTLNDFCLYLHHTFFFSMVIENLIWVSYCRLFCLHHSLHYFDYFVCQLMHNAVGNNDSMFSFAALSTAVSERRLILFLKRSDGSSRKQILI